MAMITAGGSSFNLIMLLYYSNSLSLKKGS